MDRDSDKFSSARASGTGISIGVDIGATLSKLAVRGCDGSIQYESLPSGAVDALVARIDSLAPDRIGLTGGGAARLSECLSQECERVDEFAAWGDGARQLLAQNGDSRDSPFLLVSLGTGTSVVLVDGSTSLRIGGTALGGGTVVGLGGGLLANSDFSQLCDLANRGDRSRVDLVVSDIYRPGEIDLPDDLTAASFGKLAHGKTQSAEDLACAIMGLVGENVGLICAGLSYATQVEDIVYGGSTLRNNPRLREILSSASAMAGRSPEFLVNGEYSGAVGALSSIAPIGANPTLSAKGTNREPPAYR